MAAVTMKKNTVAAMSPMWSRLRMSANDQRLDQLRLATALDAGEAAQLADGQLLQLLGDAGQRVQRRRRHRRAAHGCESVIEAMHRAAKAIAGAVRQHGQISGDHIDQHQQRSNSASGAVEVDTPVGGNDGFHGC
jgi:hypothetical protein